MKKKILITFAALAALALGQVTYKGVTSGGPNYLWNGVPLTGVSTGAGAVTNVTSGNSVTLHTAPAGKRSFVFVNFVNPTATTATYALNRVNGVNSCAIFAAATQTGASNGNVTGASTVLEPGENLQAVVSVAGQMNFVADWVDFDSTVPLKAPVLYGGFVSGNNVIYTTPTGVSALTFPRSIIGNPAGVANTAGVLIGDVTVTSNISISIGGVSWVPAFSFSAGSAAAMGIPGILPTGTTIVINSNQTGQTTSCFVMPMLWERPN